MYIYLPIADLPVNMFTILAMGLAVGFISGMFGVGGGFLMTPLLVFTGIAPAVAVATVASHVAASSFSGALSYWRKRAIDPALAFMLLCGGITGTGLGVWLFTILRSIGQLDLTISISYVILLSSVGGLMMWEGARAVLRSRSGSAPKLRRPGSHHWVHGLPLKMRFKRSKIYVSVLPVIGIGLIIGFVGAVMGIGGGFLLVPLLIYVLRVPTATVIGTSMVLTLVTMASVTVMHAVTNHLVDAVLALILMIGGVTGAQFGARAGQCIAGERLRLLLGLLVLAVGVRFAVDMVVPPNEIYTIRNLGSGAMRGRLDIIVALLVAVALSTTTDATSAERLIVSLSDHRVSITPYYSGEDLVLFGNIERDVVVDLPPAYDIVVTVTGPRTDLVTRRKERTLGIWVNAGSRRFEDVPSYLANRAFSSIADSESRRRLQIGLNHTILTQRVGPDFADVVPDDSFRTAFLRIKGEHKLYREVTAGVTVSGAPTPRFGAVGPRRNAGP